MTEGKKMDGPTPDIHLIHTRELMVIDWTAGRRVHT